MNKYKLNDICINITDGTHSTVIDDETGSSYLLSCKNVKEGKIIINKTDRIINNETLLQLRKRTKMDKGDVVLTTVGTIGESSYIKDNSPNFEFQRSVAILKPNSDLVLSQYLHYFLISKDGQAKILSRIKGAAQPCLFLNDLKIEIDGSRLNVRVGAILRYQNNIVIEVAQGRNSVIPGGRIKINEHSSDALIREIKEEMNFNLNKNKLTLLKSFENFFVMDIPYHEIYFLYEYNLSKEEFEKISKIGTNQDNNTTQFIFIQKTELEKYNVLPKELYKFINN